MPNGGYPMQFMMSIEGTDLALLVAGTTITLVRLSASKDPTRARLAMASIGTLNEDQVQALVYHLAYWGNLREQAGEGSSSSRDRSAGAHAKGHCNWTFNGRPVQPRFRTKGCSYDY